MRARASIPLIGTTPQPGVIRGTEPMTVGESDPAIREQEAFGFVSGTYAATTKYDSYPEPTVVERVVGLKKGEVIRPTPRSTPTTISTTS